MIKNLYIIILVILIIILFLIFLSFRETFQQNIKANQLDSETPITIRNSRIHIGDNPNFRSQTDKINVENTLYVNDYLHVGNIKLSYNFLKFMKKFPIYFKDKICLKDSDGVSCVTKDNINIINGKAPIKLKMYAKVFPFAFYIKPEYKGFSKQIDLTQNSSAVNLNDEVVDNKRKLLYAGPEIPTNINVMDDVEKDVYLPLNYLLEFKLKPLKKVGGWASIFRINGTGEIDNANHGRYDIVRQDRTPAIWFFPNTYRLHIVQAYEGDANAHQNPPDELEEGITTEIKIEVKNNKMKVMFDNILKTNSDLGKRWCIDGKLRIPGDSIGPHPKADAVLSDLYLTDLDGEEFSNDIIRWRSLRVDKGYEIKIFSEPNFSGEMKLVKHPGLENVLELGELWQNGIVSYQGQVENQLDTSSNNDADNTDTDNNDMKPLCMSPTVFGPWKSGVPDVNNLSADMTNIFTSEPCDGSIDQEYIIESDNMNKSISHGIDGHFHAHKFDDPAHN